MTFTATTAATPGRQSLPHHLTDLRRSGLSDQTIRESGIYTNTDPNEISKILNWSRPAGNLTPAMVIPFRSLDGQFDGFARIRPDRPRLNAGKYEQPAGVGNRAYFPAAVCEIARTPQAPLGVGEGEKKAMAATQAGVPFIGLTGVWNWQLPRPKGKDTKAHGERKLIADLAQIDWQSRPVAICFDTDSKRNPSVNHARAELARVLTEQGARVALLDLPPGPRGPDGLPGKMGIDDLIVEYGPEAFHELFRTVTL